MGDWSSRLLESCAHLAQLSADLMTPRESQSVFREEKGEKVGGTDGLVE